MAISRASALAQCEQLVQHMKTDDHQLDREAGVEAVASAQATVAVQDAASSAQKLNSIIDCVEQGVEVAAKVKAASPGSSDAANNPGETRAKDLAEQAKKIARQGMSEELKEKNEEVARSSKMESEALARIRDFARTSGEDEAIAHQVGAKARQILA
jgi:hypothetical protein